MNSNMGLFEEDRNLYFEDVGWNVDPMFSAENPSVPDFDLSSTAQDFFPSDSAFLDSSEALFNSATMLNTGNSHISPRGIAENAEQYSPQTKAKEAPAHKEGMPKMKPETVPRDEGNRQQNVIARNEDIDVQTRQRHNFALHQREAFEAQLRENELQRIYTENGADLNEATVRLEGAVEEAAAEMNVLRNIDAPELHPSHSQPVDEPRQEPIPNSGENLDTPRRTRIPFAVNVDSTETPAPSFQTNNAASDAIESLVQLPDHVRFTGDFDALLPMQALSTPADDMTTQELLQLQMQVPNQELLTNSTPTPPALSSTMVTGNFEHSLLYPVGSEYVAPDVISGVPEAAQFIQTTAGFPLQSQIPSSPGMHLDTQAMQEVVQAYQSNIHPNLQSVQVTNHGTHNQGLVSSGLQVPVSSESLQQDFTAAAGLDRRLSVRPTDGIVKKRGRKKTTRDPRKPPPTPRRKKSYNEVEQVEENASGFLVDITGSKALQRHRLEVPTTIPSPGSFEAGSPSHCRSQTPKRPSTNRARGKPSSAVDDIQPASAQNSKVPQPVPAKRAKAAAQSSSKNPEGVESGRVAKKPGKKGGRVNPETAHLSVEERRSLRAKRNRESAEKSRVRRKIQTAELEMSVAELRDENKSLKGEMLRFQSQLSTMSMEVTQHANTPAEQEQLLREHAPALLQALVVLQQGINDCPRTFRPQPHSPEIQLKVRR